MKKTALITGAASGLGLEFSKLLANDHFDLILVDIDEKNLNSAVMNLSHDYKVKIRSIVIDLGTPSAALSIYNQISGEHIDILINNAGFGLGGFFAETDWQLEESMIHLHVMTPTHLTKLIVKDMIGRKSGKVMNVSSVAAFTPGPLMNIYYSTKGYLLSFGRALSNELKGTGVSVTTVCPGLTRTNFSKTRSTLSKVETPKFGVLADSTQKVALIAYRAMLKGKAVSVPVFKNRVMAFLTWLVPTSLSVKLIRSSQSKIQSYKSQV